MSLRNSTPKAVPHTEREVMLGCFDGRLVLPHARQTLHLKSSDFLIRMGGGAASLLTERDGPCALGQLTDAHSVRPISRIVLQLHVDCKKIQLLKKSGEIADKGDPNDSETLYDLGYRAADLVVAEFRRKFRLTIPVSVSVVELVPGTLGFPAVRHITETATHAHQRRG